MIIVVEGPDGAGKSTLSSELSGRLGFPVWHPPGAVLDGVYSVEASQARDEGAFGVAAATGAGMIFDRGFTSEWVYGMTFDRAMDTKKIEALDALVAGVPHLGVLLDVDSPMEMWGRSDKHVTELDVYEKLIAHYRSYCERSGMDWIKLHASEKLAINIESVMRELSRMRTTKDHVFMDMARSAMRRSTCLSRRVGAVLVSETGHVIATAYNGAPAGCQHQTICPRLREGKASGTGLDLCDDVHAEENLIAQAGQSGSTTWNSTIFTTQSPCHRCVRMCINAGVREVVYDVEYSDPRAFALAKGSGRIQMRRL